MVNLVDHNRVTHKCIGWSDCRGARGVDGNPVAAANVHTHTHTTQFNAAVTSPLCTVHTALCWATLGQECQEAAHTT